jgi:hypothetical protein
MFDLLWPFLIVVGTFSLITRFIWSKLEFGWLQKLSFFLVLSLPFERVPSLEVSGVNIRLSYILVIVGFYFLGILLIKKDELLMKYQFGNLIYWILAFWVSLIPSLFGVINPQRQIQTLIATALVFGAAFLVSNFLEDVVKTVKWLVVTLFGVGIFGLFQFVADFVGVPYTITLLREHYTKRVFGFARIHATALEPLYWGGMLLLPCVFLLLYLIFKRNSTLYKQNVSGDSNVTNLKTEASSAYKNWRKNLSLDSIFNSKWKLLLLISVVYLNIILTLSRGAYLALSFTLLIGLLFSFRNISWKVVSRWILPYVLVISSFGAMFVVSSGSLDLINKAADHIVNVFSDRQVSTFERLTFLNEALDLVYNNALIGVGSGNYGPRVQNNIAQSDGGWLIVNNVYVEIWLEQGLTALLVFISMMFYYLGKAVEKLWKFKSNFDTEKTITLISLIAGLTGYLLQWLTFSPIFIMPVFLILGLLIRFIDSEI